MLSSHPAARTMSPPPFDPRVIQTHGAFTVLAQRHEVMFHDGQAVGLHPVLEDGLPQPYLRAVHNEGLCWVIFDLRYLCPGVGADLEALPVRDHIGVVFYSLRGQYPTRAAFSVAVVQHSLRQWWQHDVAVPA